MSHSVVLDIIKSVAEAEGENPQDLDYRLADHIDVDAVEALADQDSASFTLTFELPNHEVTVTDDERIFVEPTVESPP